MKRLLYFTLAVFAMLLFSCKGKQTQAAGTSSSEDSATIAGIIDEVNAEYADRDEYADSIEYEPGAIRPLPVDTADFRRKFTLSYSEFSRMQQLLINDLLKLNNTSVKALVDAKKMLKKHFENKTAKQCDSLYIVYHYYAHLHLGYLNGDEYYGRIPAGYFSQYDSFGDLPAEYQTIMKRLNGYGIQLEDIGEGCADLSFYPDYFYELFKPYATEPMKKYLELLAYERANEFLFDAAVCITWEELADRIVGFEEFIDEYPQMMYVSEIEGKYKGYTNLLLIGCDNTPTCDRHMDGTFKLNADVYEAYQKIIAKYKNKRLVKTLKEYCRLFEENDMEWSERIYSRK